MTNRRPTYTQEFKLQLVQLVNNGKLQAEVVEEYGISASGLSKWVKQYTNTASFQNSDNLTEEQKEIIKLRKELKQKEMEVDILKQAALLMGKR